MALIKCKECGNEVSSKAETCPKCGARISPKPVGCGALIGVIFLAIVIMSTISSIFSSTSDTKSSKTDTTALEKTSQVAVPPTKPTATRLDCASAAGVKTEAEVEPVPSQGIYAVNVTFFVKRPSNKEINRVLRDCVSAAVKLDGTKDILGSPWFRKRATDSHYDDELMNPYGGLRYLSYEATSKGIDVRDLKLKKKTP